ncbi:MAG: hypothetical protein M3Y53_10950 [Thermoproteota archaeon]|nr:hypothetical protein [Thermoproteota archaeon]
MILEAQRPLILVGNGVIRGNASSCLRRFTEQTGIKRGPFLKRGLKNSVF